ncbi:MAG: lysylphosphatidylglycerol synthase transmembrane domain-containing protein [Thermomicrobiales bacterium]
MSARATATARLRRWLPRLIGLALSVVAIVVVGPRDVARGLRAANSWLVAIAAVAVFPLLAPKARRWQIVLADFGIVLPWRDAFRFYAIGLWAAIVTPGQLGDGLKAWYVQSRGGNLAPALASVIVDRLFDVLMLLAAAALGVAVYGAAFGAQFALVGVLTVVTVAGIVVAARPSLRRRAAALLPGVARARLTRMRWVSALRDAHLTGVSLALALAWSLVSFTATLGRIYLCFRALDIRLPLVTFIAVVGLSSLAGLLSVSGIGTRDWALIALLGRSQISHETALAASFLILFLNLTNIVPGLIAWYRDPLPLRRRVSVEASDLPRAAGVAS